MTSTSPELYATVLAGSLFKKGATEVTCHICIDGMATEYTARDKTGKLLGRVIVSDMEAVALIPIDYMQKLYDDMIASMTKREIGDRLKEKSKEAMRDLGFAISTHHHRGTLYDYLSKPDPEPEPEPEPERDPSLWW